MINDLLEQLADTDVPPPPERFGEELHRPVNRALAVRAGGRVGLSGVSVGRGRVWPLPGGAIRLTLTGKYGPAERKQPPD